MNVDLWVPELQGPGGIQHYSRMFLRGLQEILPDGRVRVFSRNESYPASIPRPLTAIGFSSNLMAQTLVRRPHLTILTHLNFAPLAHLLNKFARLRYWVAAHGLESWGYLTPPRELALLCAEKILPVSHHTEQRLMGAHQLEASRSSILPNCIDGEIFFPGPKPNHLLRRYGLRPEQKVLFTLARMEPNDRYKGYDLVLDAMAEVRSTIPGVHYILAGRGSDNERLRGRIRALGLKQQVTLTGFLPRARPPRSLQPLRSLRDAKHGRGLWASSTWKHSLAAGLWWRATRTAPASRSFTANSAGWLIPATRLNWPGRWSIISSRLKPTRAERNVAGAFWSTSVSALSRNACANCLTTMCGIAGILRTERDDTLEESGRRLLRALAHRGPDGNGLHLSPNHAAAFAHTRLAIIDRRHKGGQPMSRQGLTIVFNGEIYNFRSLRRELLEAGETFSTGTDTEVLLALYIRHGPACLERLRGMFAFAIWDEATRTCFLAPRPLRHQTALLPSLAWGRSRLRLRDQGAGRGRPGRAEA